MSRKRLIGNSYDVKCVEVGENICDNSIQFYTEMTTVAGGNLDKIRLLTVCALCVCLCDYVNICMYLVLLCIFGKKLMRACVYCYTKTEFK
jgi:hypothetical protein